jgi:tRNA nucleotidyltransferase (CCA-adding enzyme)
MKTYLVGGAVRDYLMGVSPKDTDYVVVGATTKEMIAAGFKNVGASFPVFLHPETGDEYALARTERKTGPGYHGFEVVFDPSITIEQDLERRDLTINSMAMSVAEDPNLSGVWDVIDPFYGQDDLENKVLRHTSKAFGEDPLRVVRLARFYGRFTDFRIAPETVELAKDLVARGEMHTLSEERYWAEIVKAMEQGCDMQRFFGALNIFGVLDNVRFFPDIFGENSWHAALHRLPGLQAYLEANVTSAERAGIMVVVIGQNPPMKSKAMPSEVVTLARNFEKVREVMFATPENIFALLQNLRAWDLNNNFQLLVKAMAAAEHEGELFAASSQELWACALKAGHVETQVWIDEIGTGVLLGKRIAAYRTEVIKKVLEKWASSSRVIRSQR